MPPVFTCLSLVEAAAYFWFFVRAVREPPVLAGKRLSAHQLPCASHAPTRDGDVPASRESQAGRRCH